MSATRPAPGASFPELRGKVALITGAGRAGGLGEAMAKRLAREGVSVVITDIGKGRGAELPVTQVGTEDDMWRVAEAIRADGGECTPMALDVLEPAAVDAVIAATVGHYGRIDIAVNNAGIGYLMKPIAEMSVAEWDAVLGVNLRGAFLVTQRAAAAMVVAGRGGRIVNIASQAAKSGFPFASAYCASKHGLVGLTRVSAIEFGKHDITVNAICPNHVTTGLGAWQNRYFADALGISLDAYLNAMKQRIPLGRPGLVDDTANACAWLCSDQARYVTGEAMNVSGGEEYH